MGRTPAVAGIAAGVLGLSALWIMFAPAAGATTLDPNDVDIEDFVDAVVVDDVNRWFIADGAAADRVVMLDLDGEFITEVTGLGGIWQINHDDVRNVVWVSLNSEDRVIALDEVTGSVVNSINLPSHCPSAIAATANILAVGSSCGAGLARINLVDDSVEIIPGVDVGGRLESVDTQPGRVVSLDNDTVSIVGFTGPDTEVVAELVVPGAHDIALSPDGADIAIAAANVDVVGFPNLGLKHSFTTTGNTFAIEFAPDGSLVAVDEEAMLLGFKPSSSDPFWQYDLGDVEPIVGSLEVASDGSVFLLVTDSGDGGVVTPGGDPPVVGVDPGSISGEVAYAAGAPVPAGTQLLAELYDESWDLLATAIVALDYSYTFAPVNPGDYYLVFSAVDGGSASGFFPEIHVDKPVLNSAAAAAIVVAEDQHVVVSDAELRPLYEDMAGSVFAADIYWLGNSGITKGCNPPLNTLFCGSNSVTRGQLAAFLSRAFDLPNYTGPGFVDDDDSLFEADIEKLAAAGITKGCNPPVNDKFCPDSVVTRGQMAAFLVRAFGLSDQGTTDFVDDDGSVFEADIEKLAAAGITKGCNPPVNDKFCPGAPVTRSQMAAFLRRAFENAAATATSPPSIDVEPSGIVIYPLG